MGVPTKEASATVSIGTRNPVGKVPVGTVDIPVRVCAQDALKAGLEVGLLAGDQGVPAYAYEGL